MPLRAHVPLQVAKVALLIFLALAAVDWLVESLVPSALLRTSSTAPPEAPLPCETVAELERGLAAAQMRLAELSAVYGPRHPTMLAQRAHINELAAELATAKEAAEDRTCPPIALDGQIPIAPNGRLWFLAQLL